MSDETSKRHRVYPPGPFPPVGAAAEGATDLGIALRDSLFRRSVVLDARGALHSSIRHASRSPRQLMMSLSSIDALVDSWPLAAMVDDAVESWRVAATPEALSVLHRVAEVVGSVLGWPRSVDRRWPLPDEAWMRRQVADKGPLEVVRRSDRDGAAAVAVALDAPFGTADTLVLPRTRRVHGDQLRLQVADLITSLDATQEAVDLEGWVPWDDESQAALQALHSAHPLQAAYDRFGQAALVAGGGPAFQDILTDAPPGVFGSVMRRVGDAVVVPHLDANHDIHPVGILVWEGPYRAVRVHPAAVSVLDAIGEYGDLKEVARTLEVEFDELKTMLDQLTSIGAITSVDA